MSARRRRVPCRARVFLRKTEEKGAARRTAERRRSRSLAPRRSPSSLGAPGAARPRGPLRFRRSRIHQRVSATGPDDATSPTLFPSRYNLSRYTNAITYIIITLELRRQHDRRRNRDGPSAKFEPSSFRLSFVASFTEKGKGGGKGTREVYYFDNYSCVVRESNRHPGNIVTCQCLGIAISRRRLVSSYDGILNPQKIVLLRALRLETKSTILR